MSDLSEIIRRITEQHCHIWMHKRTGEIALSTDAYYLHNGRKRTIEIDVSRAGGGHHANLKTFEKSWAWICQGWKPKVIK